MVEAIDRFVAPVGAGWSSSLRRSRSMTVRGRRGRPPASGRPAPRAGTRCRSPTPARAPGARRPAAARRGWPAATGSSVAPRSRRRRWSARHRSPRWARTPSSTSMPHQLAHEQRVAVGGAAKFGGNWQRRAASSSAVAPGSPPRWIASAGHPPTVASSGRTSRSSGRAKPRNITARPGPFGEVLEQSRQRVGPVDVVDHDDQRACPPRTSTNRRTAQNVSSVGVDSPRRERPNSSAPGRRRDGRRRGLGARRRSALCPVSVGRHLRSRSTIGVNVAVPRARHRISRTSAASCDPARSSCASRVLPTPGADHRHQPGLRGSGPRRTRRRRSSSSSLTDERCRVRLRGLGIGDAVA